MPNECFPGFSWCPHVRSCYCGLCSLENGSISIGIFLVLWAIINIILRALVFKFEHYLSSFDLAITLLMLFSGALLLIGIFQCSSVSIKISLILMLIMLALFALMFSLSIVEMVQDTKPWYRETGPFTFLMYSMIMLGLLLYFFIVVLNYYEY